MGNSSNNWLTVSSYCDILNVVAVRHNKLRQPSTANDLSSAPQIIVTFEHKELLSLAKTDGDDQKNNKLGWLDCCKNRETIYKWQPAHEQGPQKKEIILTNKESHF